MAFERRRNKSYYYTKRRIDGKVHSAYVGAGYAALFAEQVNERVKADAERKRREWEAIKDEQQRLDQMVDDFSTLATAYADVLLLASGYRQHKRQWRKQRGKSTGQE